MSNENIIMKIQPNYREYFTKAIYSIIPLSIGLIGALIGIAALMTGTKDELMISLSVFIVFGLLAVVSFGRVIAFSMRSNKAKKILIKITNEKIHGTNVNSNIDIDISKIISVNIEKASVDIKYDGIPKSLKTDVFTEICGLTSKYLNIRTNDGKSIYIDCIDSLESVKNTIDTIIAKTDKI